MMKASRTAITGRKTQETSASRQFAVAISASEIVSSMIV